MSIIYLIRHGQASFATENYDRLSDIGFTQARILGEYLAGLDVRFDAAWCGTMERQRDTAATVLEQMTGPPLLRIDPRFNEYDSKSVMKKYLPVMTADDPGLNDHIRTMFSDNDSFWKVYEPAMMKWISGQTYLGEPETWAGFHQRVKDGLAALLEETGRGASVAVFCSAGPISSILRRVLGLSDETALRLTWQVKNTSVTTILYDEKRLSLSCFNSVSHLELVKDPGLITLR